MQIVINLSDKTYKDIKEENGIYGTDYGLSTRITGKVVGAIQSGTQLPKKHGRLIDADELYGDFIDGTEGYDCQTWNRIEIGDVIENAPTIIEADKE